MKRLFFLILLLPIIAMAQSPANGTYHFDLKKKKPKQQDSIPAQDDDDEETAPAPKKEKKPVVHRDHSDAYDFRRDGIFRGLFTAGLNACQIDGDAEWGYKYFGAEVGVGALARVHRFLSVSLELDYTMKGARARLQSSSTLSEYYNVQWDYVAAPIAFNAQFFDDRLMISAGLAPAEMVRYKEFNYDGINVTGHSPYGQPHTFDLDVFAGIQYTLKKHYGFGFKYSYSTISIRHALPGRENGWINGQYNNVLTFRFVYILGPLKKK